MVGSCTTMWPMTKFQDPCACFVEKLLVENLDYDAKDSKKYDEAIGYYANALSLAPTNLDILLKHSNEVRLFLRVESILHP